MRSRLYRVRDGWAEFRRLSDKLEELEALATKITPALSDMPKGGNKQKDDTWAALVDYRAQCEEQMRSYLKDCADLERELNCITSDRVRTAMKCRYIDRMQVEDIASFMRYDARSVMRFLKTGRKIYSEVYDD